MTTESGIMYSQRDILIIPIPFTDLKSIKRRPVVVISNNSYNETTEDIVVVAVTSNIEERKYSLIISEKDVEQGQLKHKSMIRVDKIYTLNQSIVVKKFGVLKESAFIQIKEILQELTG